MQRAIFSPVGCQSVKKGEWNPVISFKIKMVTFILVEALYHIL